MKNKYFRRSARGLSLRAEGMMIFELMMISLLLMAFFFGLKLLCTWLSDSQKIYELKFAAPRQKLIDEDQLGTFDFDFDSEGSRVPSPFPSRIFRHLEVINE